ncbi:quinon protein alcohol dehydrogenase-like superfamily [Blastocladiella britannica]|nr:quinon protein alcohol dehydrogenase-like superfamily [Blastocladiella britannica]
MASTLPEPPSDGISALAFIPGTAISRAHERHLVAAASWDRSVRVYDAAARAPVATVPISDPATGLAWSPIPGPHTVYTTTARGAVLALDLASFAVTPIGAHTDGTGLRCVSVAPAAAPDAGTVYTGGWDGKVCAWDPRAATRSVSPVATRDVPGSVWAMDLAPETAAAPLLVVATASGAILELDRRFLTGDPLAVRDSPLKYPTRTVACTPDGSGFALASTEGRIQLEAAATAAAAAARRFAFKCHRVTRDGTEFVYPVNAIAFHPRHPMTFASGGADGTVGLWDGIKRKRIRLLLKDQPTSISSLSFSADGDMIAAAVSYTWERGSCPHPPDSIVVRPFTDADVRSKK